MWKNWTPRALVGTTWTCLWGPLICPLQAATSREERTGCPPLAGPQGSGAWEANSNSESLAGHGSQEPPGDPACANGRPLLRHRNAGAVTLPCRRQNRSPSAACSSSPAAKDTFEKKFGPLSPSPSPWETPPSCATAHLGSPYRHPAGLPGLPEAAVRGPACPEALGSLPWAEAASYSIGGLRSARTTYKHALHPLPACVSPAPAPRHGSATCLHFRLHTSRRVSPGPLGRPPVPRSRRGPPGPSAAKPLPSRL
ncbi:nascent polypeptide-associated complex subunit alpha, muscle-specific form-like [Prionailurus viverrinus]|uniref:nascent polypeptide-associated complex subunit alpha, muscle-specific form-like n=1 Tax=Prionailurus viverrinus TaxID=61388 RepID=UPI001FF4B01A|nr:nascent polypeptide-associated complex subunit alpha, muscle-specific form-like [Prionailurus viverrinus]